MIFSFRSKKGETFEKTSDTTHVAKKHWLQRLQQGLGKTSSHINEGIKNILVRKKLDQAALEALEELLILADIGPKTSTKLCHILAERYFDKTVTIEEIKYSLAQEISHILQPSTASLSLSETDKPHVIVMCGVNGAGKTTTIGKLGAQLHHQGKKVMYAACDTFRAAAVEQLNSWAHKTDAAFVAGAAQADPASVAYQAYSQARNESYDALLIDTAGRLHNKTNLMEQLKKVITVLKKIHPDAPHDIVIVLDATTGQNAVNQVKIFKEMIHLTGMIITKLDGTAKGGMVVSLAEQFQLPVYALGVGESYNDLQAFQPDHYAQNLLGIEK